jgi:autotransporter-associated beta strand protein
MDSLFRRAVCLRVSSLCRSRAALCIAVVALATVVAAPASAATLTWGFSGGGGNGPWASVGPNNNWWNGTARVAWTGGYNDMWFTGQPGTVSVYINGYATANSLTFTNYTSSGTYAFQSPFGRNSYAVNLRRGGITMSPSSGAARLESIFVSESQSWTNNSGSLLTITGNVWLNGKNLTLTGGGNGTISGGISSTGSLTKNGAGTWTLVGSNTYSPSGSSPAAIISGGTLQVGDGGTTGSLPNAGGASVSSGAVLAFNRSDNVTYGGAISGAGGVTKLGAGKLTFTAAGLYTGATIISGGTLALAGCGLGFIGWKTWRRRNRRHA